MMMTLSPSTYKVNLPQDNFLLFLTRVPELPQKLRNQDNMRELTELNSADRNNAKFYRLKAMFGARNANGGAR